MHTTRSTAERTVTVYSLAFPKLAEFMLSTASRNSSAVFTADTADESHRGSRWLRWLSVPNAGTHSWSTICANNNLFPRAPPLVQKWTTSETSCEQLSRCLQKRNSTLKPPPLTYFPESSTEELARLQIHQTGFTLGVEQIQLPGLPNNSASRHGASSVDSVVRKGNYIHCVTNSAPIRTQNTVTDRWQQRRSEVSGPGDSERLHTGRFSCCYVLFVVFASSVKSGSLESISSASKIVGILASKAWMLLSTEHSSVSSFCWQNVTTDNMPHLSIPAVIIDVKSSCKVSSLCFLNVPLCTIHCHGMVF